MFVLRRVVGNSMLPTLQPGRVVVGFRWRRTIAPGNLVIIKHKGIEKIKRVQYMQGQEVLVVGDNPSQSTDSRDFGPVLRSSILAKVIWPRILRS